MPDEDDSVIPGVTDAVRFTFGMIESRLARMHEIASDKRTQFQARLRNFQRLRAHPIPFGIKAGRGKTVLYTPGQVVEIALALELTQLGLLPERIEEIFKLNKFPIYMAVRIAAIQLIEKGGFRPDKERKASHENLPMLHGKWSMDLTEEEDPLSMFLYFDPSTLDALTPYYPHGEGAASATFFYGGAGIVRENIVRWTAGPYIRRLSLINVTAMLWSLIQRSKPENQALFLQEVVAWADSIEEAEFVETVKEGDVDNALAIETYEDVVTHADAIRHLRGVPPMVTESMIKLAQQMVDAKRGKETAEIPPELGPPTLTPGMTEAELEDQLVKLMTSDGLPEFVARGFMEQGRSERAKRRAELAAQKAVPKVRRKRRTKNDDGA